MAKDRNRHKEVSKFAERMAREHFEHLGCKLKYEPEIGGRHPEFGILNDADEIEAVFEVKSVTQEGKGVQRFRKAIERARAQAGAAKAVPVLVIIDPRGTIHTTLERLSCEAMFGTAVIRGTTFMSGRSEFRSGHLQDGKMIAPNGQPQNTSISAVGTMNQRILSFASPEGTDLDSLPEWMKTAAEQQGARSDFGVYGGIRFFVCRFEYMKIVPNPHARLPWPVRLIGPWDEVYECAAGPRLVRQGALLSEVPKGFVDQ